MAYHRRHGLEVRIARIFNTYGPGMRPDDGRVVSNFVTQAIRGEPLTVYGDGSQTRSLCYVDDLAAGLLALLGFGLHGPVNLGNDDERTVLEVAQLVLELSQSTSGIVFVPRPADDPSLRRPDLTRARQELGWEPTTLIRDGLPPDNRVVRRIGWAGDGHRRGRARRPPTSSRCQIGPVAAVVVNYNAARLLPTCLDSLAGQRGRRRGRRRQRLGGRI